MPDPTALRQAAQILARGAFGMATDEVAGAWRRRHRPTAALPAVEPVIPRPEGEEGVFATLPAPDPATTGLPEYTDLPSLAEVELGETVAGPPRPRQLPEDLFGSIVGFDTEKRVLRRVILSDSQLHALLIGPPGSAKSLFLEELRRLPDSRYVVGRNMTSTGLMDILGGEEGGIEVLLIDEIDKADQGVLGTLLAAMTGKATRAVHGKHLEIDTDVRVVAAANTAAPLHEALRSRFIELHLAAYTLEQRKAVIAGFLANRKGVEAHQAKEIADLVAPLSADVRDAEQIAAVAKDDPALARELAKRLETDPRPGAEVVRRRTRTAP